MTSGVALPWDPDPGLTARLEIFLGPLGSIGGHICLMVILPNEDPDSVHAELDRFVRGSEQVLTGVLSGSLSAALVTSYLEVGGLEESHFVFGYDAESVEDLAHVLVLNLVNLVDTVMRNRRTTGSWLVTQEIAST